jgi:hypothetical protein
MTFNYPPWPNKTTTSLLKPEDSSLLVMAFSSLFRNPQRLRRCIDVRVGRTHTVEVLFHLRRQDYDNDWYNTHADEIHAEILEMFESTILSRMFGREIESYHRLKHPHLFPPGDDGDDDDIIGSKNKSKKRRRQGGKKADNKTKSNNNKKIKTSEVSESSVLAAAGGSGSKGIDNDNGGDGINDDDVDCGDGRSTKVYYSFGSTIQLAYRKQPIDNVTHRTILVKPSPPTTNDDDDDDGEDSKNDNQEDKIGGGSKRNRNQKKADNTETSQQSSFISFYDLEKLPYRLLVWISPSSTGTASCSNIAVESEEFFHRPEMIPVSSLFRTPKELLDDDDDEDEDDDDDEGETEF